MWAYVPDLVVMDIQEIEWPPLPTVTSSGESISTACCALKAFRKREKWFLVADGTSLSFGCLSFFYWVAFERSLNEKIPPKERLTCPFLWCRKQCKGTEALLSHVVKCNYLDTGQYWCPLCQKAELFSEPLLQHSSKPILRSENLKKSSNVTRKYLVRKAMRLVRKIAMPIPPRTCANKLSSNGNTGYIPPAKLVPAELKDTAPVIHHDFNIPELPDNSYAIGCRQSVSNCVDLEGQIDSNLTRPQLAGESRNIRLHGQFNATEIDVCHSDAGGAGDSSGPFISNNATEILADVETHCMSWDPASCDLNTDMIILESTMDTFMSEFISPSFTSFSSPYELLPPYTEPVDLNTIMPPDCKLDTPTTMCQNEKVAMDGTDMYLSSNIQETSPVQASFETRQDGASKDRSVANRNTKSLFHDLVIIFGILYKQISVMLAQMPSSLSVFQSTLPREKNIIEAGLQVLRNVLEGVSINSAMELHTMLHLACVSAIMTNEYNTGEIFDRISTSIVACGHALQSHNERSLFVLASGWIWGTKEGQDNQTHNINRSISSDHNSCVQQPPGAFGRQTLPIPPFTAAKIFPSLQQSWVVQMCKQLLANFEYFRLLETPRGITLDKNLCSTSPIVRGSSAIPVAWSEILRTLMGDFGLEGFDPVIRNVATMIHNGEFMNIREIELKLIHDGRYNARDYKKYRCFLKLIHNFCTSIKGQRTAISCANEEYLPTIDFLCASLSNDPSHHKLPSGSPGVRNDGMTNMGMESIATSSATGTIDLKPAEPTGSCSSLTSTNSTSISIPSTCSIATRSSVSSSRTLRRLQSVMIKYPEVCHEMIEPIQSHIGKSMECPLCKKTFKGNGRYLKANLKRHIDSQYSRNRERMKCPNPECHLKFTRVDNLRAHIRRQHADQNSLGKFVGNGKARID
ncbi:hypothetical protein MMC17_008136 [Xylographa soralifera]|nr:hypothetical protein [Xylographa soralifera]